MFYRSRVRELVYPNVFHVLSVSSWTDTTTTGSEFLRRTKTENGFGERQARTRTPTTYSTQRGKSRYNNKPSVNSVYSIPFLLLLRSRAFTLRPTGRSNKLIDFRLFVRSFVCFFHQLFLTVPCMFTIYKLRFVFRIYSFFVLFQFFN